MKNKTAIKNKFIIDLQKNTTLHSALTFES